MGVADRLSAPVTANGDDGIPIAPGGTSRDDVTGLFDTGVNLADTKSALRPTADATYSVNADFRDARGNRVVEVDTDAAGADTFTLSFRCDPNPDGTYGDRTAGGGTTDVDGVFTTGALQDDDTAATIQTAVRAALPGTDLTVVIGDAPGPFYIIFDREFWARRYPVVTGTGTGCTVTPTAGGTLAAKAFQEDAGGTGAVVLVPAEVRKLGESKRVNESDSILKPTIGTISVDGAGASVASIDAVHRFDYDAGIDGGTVSFGFRGSAGFGITGGLAFDSTAVEVQAALDAIDAVNSPVVTGYGTADVQTLELNDIGDGDDFHLTHAAIESAQIDIAETDDDNSALIQAAVEGLAAFVPGDVVVTKTDGNTYVMTFDPSLGPVSAFTITNATGFTPTGVTDSATGAADGFDFTFSRGFHEGRPVPLNTLVIYDDQLTDGGVAEPGTLTSETTGVLATASAAYTENGAGDAVLVAAINDTTGKSYGFVLDAGTPIAVQVPPGTYHLVMRTVEDGRVSKADSKAFTCA